jgi:hypothetical protein
MVTGKIPSLNAVFLVKTERFALYKKEKQEEK